MQCIRERRIIAGSVMLLSLLLGIAYSELTDNLKATDYEIDEEDMLVEHEDLILGDVEYDYEEVVGEETHRNVMEFQKHPGVYVIDLEGVLYALDADNGEILWIRKVSDKFMKVEESQVPPMNYKDVSNGSSLQYQYYKPFNKMLVSLDGYILLPRVDGKFNVFQDSIDNIIDKDTVTVNIPDREGDTSILFMGGKKSTFISLDDVSGKISSFGTEEPQPGIEVLPSLSEVRVIRVEKNVNCFNNNGYEYWNITTNTLSLQFSTEIMRHLPNYQTIHELVYNDDFSIQAIDNHGSVMWTQRFSHVLMQSYYASNNSFVLVRNSHTVSTGQQSISEGVNLLNADTEAIDNHVLLALLFAPAAIPCLPLLEAVEPNDMHLDSSFIPLENVTYHFETAWPIVKQNLSRIYTEGNSTFRPAYRTHSFLQEFGIVTIAVLFAVTMFIIIKWCELHSEPISAQENETKPATTLYEWNDTTIPEVTEENEETEPSTSAYVSSHHLTEMSASSSLSIPLSSADYTVKSQLEESVNTQTIQEDQSHGQPEPSTFTSDVMHLHQITLQGVNMPLCTGRYKQDFIEESLLGRGGFGSVFLSRKSFEGIEYAVKKVSFTSNGTVTARTLRVLREVRIFARFDHVNIVRFYNAWLEFVPNELLKREIGLEEEDEEDDDEFISQLDSDLPSDVSCAMTTEITNQLTTQNLSVLIGREPDPLLSINQELNSVFDDLDTQSMNWKEQLNTNTNCPFIFEDNSLSKYEKSSSSSSSSSLSSLFQTQMSSSSSSSSTTTTTTTMSTTLPTQMASSSTTMSTTLPTQMASSSTTMSTTLPTHKTSPSSTSSTPQTFTPKQSIYKSVAASTRSILQKNTLVLYIQMAYCGKRTLNDYLQDSHRIVNEDEIVNVCIELGRALEYLHHNQVIHRDVKPANIFYSEDGHVRLGDFGLSRDFTEKADAFSFESPCEMDSTKSHIQEGNQPIESSDTATTTLIGTRIYSSPEQLSDTSCSYDYKSDIYAAGIVLYEMTFPKFKTMFERFEVLNQPRNGSLPETREGISHAFYDLIKTMVQLDPKKRPTASEVVKQAIMIKEKKRKMVIQVSNDNTFNTQQLIISSQLQNLELSRFIRSITYDADNYQIIVTLNEIDEDKLKTDIASIQEMKGVVSVDLTSM